MDGGIFITYTAEKNIKGRGKTKPEGPEAGVYLGVLVKIHFYS